MQANRSGVNWGLNCLLPFLICSFIFSCTQKRADTVESSLLDSLNERCYTLVMQLQVDSLRMAAEEFMKAAPKGSKRFFKARQFYINSYFNARNYDKVISLLDGTERMEHFNDYPAIVSDYTYTRARCFQYSARYPEAIEAFKRCLSFCPEDVDKQEEVVASAEAAMTQLMNTYIQSNKLEEGYSYFKQMKELPNPVIQRFLLRDSYIHLAYLCNQSGRVKEACHLADTVFKMPLYKSTPQKLFRDYSYGAVIYYTQVDMWEQAIQWLERAMEEADKYAYMAGVQWSVDLLATIYWQSNKIEEGTELQYKALEMSQKRGDKSAVCNSYISLADLYRDWELYKQADEFADRAIHAILSTDDMKFRGVAFRAKGVVKSALNQPDSALFYLIKSAECAEKAQMQSDKCGYEADIARVLIDHCREDSLEKGVTMMREVLKKTKESNSNSYNYYSLGKGLIKQGKNKEGEIMLDSMYRQTYQNSKINFVDGVLEYVIDYYLSQGNHAKVAQYTSLYRKQMDNRFDEKTSRKVASAMVAYQTEKKEQQLKLAKVELAVKNLRIKLYLAALAVLILIISGGFLWYLYKRKIQKNRLLLAEQERLIALRDRELSEVRLHERENQLVSALENLREANEQSEQMREQLDDFLANRENQQGILSITPSLLREQGEIKFRRYFTQVYPGFLASLREIVPDITRGEEVLSMLIALGQNMEETADILCIERKSVKMSRYRLRKKLPVEPEITLDSFVRGLLSGH